MLQKQSVNINFAQGLDTKTDPWQVPAGRFLSLENSIFLKGGLLQKRNGYKQLPNLPKSAQYVTTFNDDLTAVGSSIQALPQGLNQWVSRGNVQPVGLSTMSLVKNNLNQVRCDASISSNNLICTVYSEQINATPTYKYKYVIADALTGQNIVVPTEITGADATYGSPRVFLLPNYFIIIYTGKVGASYYLYYIAINSTSPSQVSSPVQLPTSCTVDNNANFFDGASAGNFLFVFFNSTAGVKFHRIDNLLNVYSAVTVAAGNYPYIRACANVLTQTFNVVWYTTATFNGYTCSYDVNGNPLFAAGQIFNNVPLNNLIIIPIYSGVGTFQCVYQYAANYSWTGLNYILAGFSCSGGGTGPTTIIKRGAGIASQGIYLNGNFYFLACYVSTNQPTYFLLDTNGNIYGKLAYQNGDGYYFGMVPKASLIENTIQIPYLYKDLITSVNKNINVPTGSQVAGVYSQLGINLSKWSFDYQIQSVEIGNNLNLTAGYTYMYDGYSVTEQNFHLYPDDVQATLSLVGGNINSALTYYYAVTYEWTDNQGNAFISAPSVPVKVNPNGAVNIASVTLNIPTLRMTSKISNPVKICVYRWSSAQSTFYQTIANYLVAPTLNDTTIDEVTVVDTLADASIIGNPILYTTGGVVENIGPPSFSNVFLFDSRLWGISSEDPNLLWYSKQVIEATPVEMSDLFTMYIPPSLGAQGPSGNLTAGFPMDDKAILFKQASISYFNGTGPDNTGANSSYSPPILVTTTLGCSNAQSIVFMPNGLMFEFSSESGNQIWLLGRDLSTTYIGAPVEALTQNATVQSAINVPGTNQVRFTMSSGITLMYDYFYQQWGTFTGVPATSSTLYQGLHTYINSLQQVFQETPSLYLDGSSPVLMRFKTSWINVAGIQGYQRAFFFFLLGKYYSPHKLLCQIAYDFNDSYEQASIIIPDNFNPNYGNVAGNGQTLVYGQPSPYGGPSSVEQWRVFLSKQRCSAFQLDISELFDSSYQVTAGAGFTLSGLNLVVAVKKSFRTQTAATSVGG